MDLRQLRQFVTVAELLSFRRAAERLHMAQPPLSVAIAKLEAELCILLFERRGRTIALTPAGAAVLPLAQKCLAVAREIPVVATNAARGESGTLRIGFVGSATYSLLPKLMPAFRERFPAVEVELREAINTEVLSKLDSGDFDIGLIRVPTHQSPSMRFDLCERDVFRAVVPASHPLATRRRVTLKMLAAEPLIGFAPSRVPGLSHLVTMAFHYAGVSPRIAQQALQVQTIISLVESGMGVALVPGVSERYASHQIVFRPIADLPPMPGLGLALASLVANSNPIVDRLREVAGEVIPIGT